MVRDYTPDWGNDNRIECIVGIVDSLDVVHSKVCREDTDRPTDNVHEDLWPMSGRGKRWRWWPHDGWNTERSDIHESRLDEEDFDRIDRHLLKILNADLKRRKQEGN